jgi:hypothetical protein
MSEMEIYLARRMYEAGRESADLEIAAQLLEANNITGAKATADLDERMWGPGGRAYFADPRPGDFPGRNAETEAAIG